MEKYKIVFRSCFLSYLGLPRKSRRCFYIVSFEGPPLRCWTFPPFPSSYHSLLHFRCPQGSPCWGGGEIGVFMGAVGPSLVVPLCFRSSRPLIHIKCFLLSFSLCALTSGCRVWFSALSFLML